MLLKHHEKSSLCVKTSLINEAPRSGIRAMRHFVILQVQPAASRMRIGGGQEPCSHEFLGLWGPSGGKSEVMKKICPVLLHQGSHAKVLRRHLAMNQRNLSPLYVGSNHRCGSRGL